MSPGIPVEPGPAVVACFRFEASGPAPIEVSQLTITSDGTIEEPMFLGGLRAVHDLDLDDAHDAGEPELSRRAAPAFPQNDGSAVVDLNPPLVVTPGQAAQLLLVVEILFPAPTAQHPLSSMPGETIVHGLQRSSDVVARASGAPLTPSGRFPLAAVVLYQINDHVLISEVGLGQGQAYVELFNPTPDTVDLSDYYLSDATEPGRGYHLLPTGSGFQATRGTDDVLGRLPPGASIRSGQVLTIAFYGETYRRNFGTAPNFSLYDRVQQWYWDTIHFPVGTPVTWLPRYYGIGGGSGPTARWRDVPFGTLRWRGEALVLFTWDGQSDTVQDVDMVAWGAAAPPADARFDKTGASSDGPDADSLPTSYRPDTPAANQSAASAPSSRWTTRYALRRLDYLETGQRGQGGNGITGHDETSEPWHLTFVRDYPEPGRP